ncbi:MAG: hypothetical protein DDG59_15385 [Anaerolineae bacterium]|jgi:hypothetical protein|nr:MAG: hypothetical protein DDG59_15385 [Anaerolineae bacterium]
MSNPEADLSDQELRQHVVQVLAADEQLRHYSLRIGVASGFVHLGGKLSSLEGYERVEALVRNLPGVKGVINRIQAPGAPSPARVIHLFKKEDCFEMGETQFNQDQEDRNEE